ncbi:Cas10/Cmr2 second palm domain-containing protein [Rubrivivax benzoatilyticus]|uniref:Cas10/Cmr2 second palm domain-containing protein n=1 Tax=Rubrivivax benzoatilyticus TaxID=316997 RepID=A0ABX0HWW3_9BURK|nr:hypothetical protein [Rubrivivax benzoatilyticus]EGJ09044.1 hypothetical protein RBXJA2T_01885 [Rubrivivax benzoatilyticus JA2 = ATCC BAA-35]NHK99501.1 hypothetical protein [Rubrivivax benzoatilyticus]NHL25375.1 hypothetical protein [Rubrivivax benzoatilyticus]
MPTYHCWTFECGSIQSFIFETGRLADAVGASLLVDRLTGDLDETADAAATSLLQQVMQTAGCATTVRFSRRGGGSFIAFLDSDEARRRVRTLWHAALAANATGLRWADAVADAPSALAAARDALRACQQAGRVDRPRLPEAGPLTLRVARTGQPAVTVRSLAGQVEAIDAATELRRRHARRTAVADTLLQRFGAPDGLRWPRHTEPSDGSVRDDGDGFPFVGGARELAFLHADGNGLGVLLRRLETGDDGAYVERYAAFSRAVTQATVAAARQAAAEVLLPAAVDGVVPARPLILGGDDLSLVVRADLALPFAEAYLQAFECQSTECLAALRGLGLDLPGLTAACGIAIVKARFPFAQAAALAEALCQRAKSVIKREAQASARAMPLSALAVQRVTTSVPDDALPRVQVDGRHWTLGHAAYVIGEEGAGVPRLADLQTLAQALATDAMPRGPVRRLLTDFHQDPTQALERWRRWRENLEPARVAEIDALLRRLGVDDPSWLPLGRDGSPWPDAVLLRDLTRDDPDTTGGAA